MSDKDLEDFKSIKDDLNRFDTNDNDQDFIKLVTMNDIDPKLRENLILLHSNYKTEIKDLKSFVYKTLYKTVDRTEHSLTLLNKEVAKSSAGIVSHAARNIAMILGVVVIAFIILFIFAVINPDAFTHATEALKSFMPSVFGLDKEIIMQAPPTQ